MGPLPRFVAVLFDALRALGDDRKASEAERQAAVELFSLLSRLPSISQEDEEGVLQCAGVLALEGAVCLKVMKRRDGEEAEDVGRDVRSL